MSIDSAPWNDARRLLCVRLDALGDVLMTMPALRALKESRPQSRLTLLTSSTGAEAARLVPEVDEVIVYDAPWMKATAPRQSSSPDLRMVQRLRREEFDGAIIFTVYSQSPLPAALLCYLADIPRRLAHCRENPYQLLTDWIPDPEPAGGIRHEVRRQLDLVAAIGCWTSRECLSLQVPPDAHRRVAMLLHQLGLRQRGTWVVMHPGASAPSRRYPPELYAAVADQLVETLGWHVLFTGSASEQKLIQQIQRQMHGPSLSLAGRLKFAELAALIQLAPLVIANNTGPVHVAAAVGTPVVVLYALTNPQHTPWAVSHRVLSHDVPCKNCCKSICPEGHHDCLRKIPPESVLAAAQELYTETQRSIQPAAYAQTSAMALEAL